MKAIVRGLTERAARTAPDADDRRLLGRTYTIPFEEVWQASIRVIRRRLRGWTVVIDDDRRGRIDALHRTLFRGVETEVVIDIGLDENGQTRVDLAAASRGERGDWGRCRRLIGRFLKGLDRELEVSPGQVLQPVHPLRVRETA